MAETVKRGRGRPRKVVEPQTTKKTTYDTEKLKKAMNEITMDDIKSAMEQFVNERFAEEGVKPKVEQSEIVQHEEPKVVETDVYTSEVPMMWNGFYNILIKMYASDDNPFDIVKFNPIKQHILVVLDSNVFPSVEDEIKRMKVVSCYHSLKYSGEIKDGKTLITISM